MIPPSGTIGAGDKRGHVAVTEQTTEEKARFIAEQIEGTCQSLHGVLEQHEMDGLDNDQNFCDTLDGLVFECKTCGWWFEMSEMSADPAHDWECDGCSDDHDLDD